MSDKKIMNDNFIKEVYYARIKHKLLLINPSSTAVGEKIQG